MIHRSALAAIAGLLITAPALAGHVVTGIDHAEAIVTALGPDSSALTYWSAGPNGRQIVTTIDTVIRDGEGHPTDRHSIVRVSGVVAPGQPQVISIPSFDNAPTQLLEIRQTGDRIEVVREAPKPATMASNLD